MATELGATPADLSVDAKSTLVDDRGLAYREFRRTLTPRFGRVWRDIILGYAAIVALLALLVAFADFSVAGVAFAVLGSIGIGYAAEFLSNFFHEAAHYNVAPNRQSNDRLTNLFFGWLYWKNIEAYRTVHFQHHRALGTTMDSENSYFDALRIRYLAAGILGLNSLRAMRRWNEVEEELAARKKGPKVSKEVRLGFMAYGAAVDVGVAAILWLGFGSPLAAFGWLWGILFVFPFLGSLRQLLEHRSEEAEADTDYSESDHGAVNRLFGEGPVSSTLGSAGFNRHALHHWEPNVSYTRLGDLEKYLMRTDMAPQIEARQTSYTSTFLRLLEL